MTIASPCVVSFTAHGLIAGDSVQFTTTGALPTGLSASTDYYVIAAGLTANTFQFAATVGGTAINTTGSQSGVHTLFRTTPYAVGNEDTRFLQNTYQTDTGAANAYAITPSPAFTAYKAGQIFVFKAVNANTTASTLNVNGLGLKTIKKNVSTDLVANDILASQIVEVVYDGTNFQLVSTILTPTPAPAVASGNTSYALTTASGTQNIAHGLGVTPRLVRLSAASSTNASASGTAGSSSTRAVITGGVTSSESVAQQSSSSASSNYSSNTNTFRVSDIPGVYYQEATITVNSTNIVISWSKVGTPTSTANIIWDATA